MINCELALADMAQIERRLERLGKGRAKSTEEKASELVEREVLAKLSANLNEGKPARLVDLKPDEWALVKDLMLLTAKPCVYAANVNEGDLADNGESNEYVRIVRKHAAEEGSVVTIISAQVESELIKLDVEEREEFLADLGATEGGLKSLIRNAYSLLGLQTYFTTGEKETRAWTIKKGFTAPQAAGVIHGDFEKGFIKAGTCWGFPKSATRCGGPITGDCLRIHMARKTDPVFIFYTRNRGVRRLHRERRVRGRQDERRVAAGRQGVRGEGRGRAGV